MPDLGRALRGRNGGEEEGTKYRENGLEPGAGEAVRRGD